jgi:hypothetical protein
MEVESYLGMRSPSNHLSKYIQSKLALRACRDNEMEAHQHAPKRTSLPELLGDSQDPTAQGTAMSRDWL